jgi:hypothetical protein
MQKILVMLVIGGLRGAAAGFAPRGLDLRRWENVVVWWERFGVGIAPTRLDCRLAV